MNIIIRNEEEKDYKKVEEVAIESFWNLYFPGCSEHVAIHRLRNHKDFIKELSFVIEVDGEIVGSIFYSKAKIISNDKEVNEVIAFGPVNIHPKYHRKGLGKKLITHSISKAKELGYKAIFTLGYNYHYEPYGFVGSKKYNVSMGDGKFYKGLLALELFDDALDNISGYIEFSEALEPTIEEIEEYNKNFKLKEKKITESQKEFEKYVGLLDE